MAEKATRAHGSARRSAQHNALSREASKRVASTVAVTVLFLLALFFLWQAWVMSQADPVRSEVKAAQQQTVARLGHTLAAQRTRIAQALADPTLQAGLAAGDAVGLATATARAHALLPRALEIDFYSPTLDDVLKANFGRFGYAKAAQLMQLQSGAGKSHVVVLRRSRRHVLGLALPATDARGQRIAYAWVTWPADAVIHALQQSTTHGGRFALRQDESDQAPALIATGGTNVEPGTGPVLRVPGSELWVTAAMPRAPVFLPGHWPLAVLLAVVAFIIAGAWLGMRWRRSRAFAEAAAPAPEPEAHKEPSPPAAGAARAPAPAAAEAPAPRKVRVEVDPSIFRAYDIRGVVGKQLTPAVARALGQAIGALMREKELGEIVVGRDGRLSGPDLVGGLSDGLRAAGVDVIDVGAVPTPLVYFATHHLETGCGVAVTGSHNPPDYNGFKVVVGGETLSEGAIADLGQRIATGTLPVDGLGTYRQADIVEDYLERIASDVQAEHPLKVVADAGNGIAGDVAPRLLEMIGCEVVPLFCEVDGTFPNHHPDPSDPHNLEDLKRAVAENNADLGVAFDGDGDRLGVVTRAGEIIYPDRVLMLFARDVLARNPGATIIYDVKCTGHLGPEILAAGGSPLMWRTGHSLIKAKMKATQAALAGEMSGHFFFRERWYGFDDGMYSAARLMEILAGDVEGRTPDAIFATLPKGVSTPELKIPMAEGENHAFVERFQKHATFEGARLTTIDGVRADWPDGWGLVRASNTTPVLVLRFDAKDEAALKRIEQVFREQLLAVEPALKLGF